MLLGSSPFKSITPIQLGHEAPHPFRFLSVRLHEMLHARVYFAQTAEWFFRKVTRTG